MKRSKKSVDTQLFELTIWTLLAGCWTNWNRFYSVGKTLSKCMNLLRWCLTVDWTTVSTKSFYIERAQKTTPKHKCHCVCVWRATTHSATPCELFWHGFAHIPFDIVDSFFFLYWHSMQFCIVFHNDGALLNGQKTLNWFRKVWKLHRKVWENLTFFEWWKCGLGKVFLPSACRKHINNSEILWFRMECITLGVF